MGTSGSLIDPQDLLILAGYAEQAPPGAFVEVGVYRGGSARVLYRVAERQGRTLFLFDTFAGHPAPSEYDDPAHYAGRYADCIDPDVLQDELPNARVVIGRFPLSMYRYLPWIGMGTVAFAHIDVDLYESTRDAITALTPFMVPGGVLYFDDYGVHDCPGTTKAVDEACPVREVLPSGKAIVRVG